MPQIIYTTAPRINTPVMRGIMHVMDLQKGFPTSLSTNELMVIWVRYALSTCLLIFLTYLGQVLTVQADLGLV